MSRYWLHTHVEDYSTAMMSTEYKLIRQEWAPDPAGDESQVNDNDSQRRTWSIVRVLVGLLAISFTFNLVAFVQACKTLALRNTQSEYAGLQRNVPVSILHDNRTIDDTMWDDPMFDTNVGVVALSDDFSRSKGLLPAQRWPWDHSKGTYVLQGYHSLHCVIVLRQTILEFQNGVQLTWDLSHVTHCLHVIREDVICNADDFPRYTGRLNAEAGHSHASSGTGDIHMCRDWTKLQGFALEHSACYKPPSDEHSALVDYYKSCPDGSRPWQS